MSQGEARESRDGFRAGRNDPPASRFAVQILVAPRPGLLDPQGKAIQRALASLGFGAAGDVRVGKAIRMTVDAPSSAAAQALADEMCRKLLANPVTEDFKVTVDEAPTAVGKHAAGGEHAAVGDVG